MWPPQCRGTAGPTVHVHAAACARTHLHQLRLLNVVAQQVQAAERPVHCAVRTRARVGVEAGTGGAAGGRARGQGLAR